MSLKIDQLLDQLNGIETFLKESRTDEARAAIHGIRHLLLTSPNEAKPETSELQLDDEALTSLLTKARARPLLKGDAIQGLPGRTDFDDSLVCWGWYDTQLNSVQKRYRWCGASKEAGVLLPFQPSESAILVLVIQALASEKFDARSCDMTVNGRPVQLRILSGAKSTEFYLVITPQTVKANNVVEICLYPKNPKSPQEVGLSSSDPRKLGFNVSEYIWLSVE